MPLLSVNWVENLHIAYNVEEITKLNPLRGAITKQITNVLIDVSKDFQLVLMHCGLGEY